VLFTGWDWASASHAVTILDSTGEVVDRWVFAHTERDLDPMLARLASIGSPAELPVAIERAAGLVVDRLLAAGHPVVAIDPGAFHAARPRWGAAGTLDRSRRQLQARGLPAHRRPPAAPAGAAGRGHSRAASAGPAAR
jgi:hypothetical protein